MQTVIMAGGTHRIEAILGGAPAMAALRAQVQRLAAFDKPGSRRAPTVLLQGETGSGKGLVARVIHGSGPRAAGAFVDVNCGAIPETMIEAELFGFEAGAFTDAKRAKPGLFEAASGGTLFLDEIDSLPLPLQSKVLTAIEEKRVRRLGAVAPRDVDVKLIAATQRDLKGLVAAGAFRADLYHRLAVIVLGLPPLRERGEDVLLLADHFLRTYAEAHGLAPKHLSPSACAWLRSYAWPGNVRELAHLMERVTLLSVEDEIGDQTLSDLAEPMAVSSHLAHAGAGPNAVAEGAGAGDDERTQIEAALARAGGNVVRAAKMLGIGRNALRYRMRRLGITRSGDGGANAAGDAAPSSPSGETEPAVAHAARQPSWEQRPVVVLCISIDFPEPSAVDREPWTEARRWERIIDENVSGFGGVFLQRSPSRLTAAFGVPRALEQMAERAVQAALAIQRATGGEGGPEIRAALHVGEARLEASAPDPLAELFPVGAAFTLPERLLGHTGAGEILISAEAARRVARRFQLQPRPVRLGPAEADRLRSSWNGWVAISTGLYRFCATCCRSRWATRASAHWMPRVAAASWCAPCGHCSWAPPSRSPWWSWSRICTGSTRRRRSCSPSSATRFRPPGFS
jgi:DNA-binding NtrC family response regulator